MSAEALIQSITESASSRADRLVDKAISYGDQAVTSSYLYMSGNTAPTINPDLIKLNPQQFNPVNDLRTEYDNKYKEMFDNLVPLAKKNFYDFLAATFPNESQWNQLGTFLLDAVSNGGIGLPQAEEEKIWQRARDREMLQAQAVANSAISNASARGHTIPPGWVLGAQVAAYNQASKNLSAQNTDIAIKVAEIRIEWVKNSIDKVIQMRQMALQSALEFMNNIYKASDSANQKASSYISSYQSFYGALNSYYNAVSNINELKFKIDSTNAELKTENYKIYTQGQIGALQARAQAAAEMAKSMGVLAGSVSAGITTLAQVGNNTEIQQ